MKKAIFTLLTVFLMMSCEDMFDYSPYSAKVPGDMKNQHIQNLNSIKTHKKSTKFSFAVISDSHFQYKYIGKAIDILNSRDDIDFVIHGGDIAHTGSLMEYEMFHEAIKSLHKPYFTVIGNHDYRSNGEDIYKDMYGDYNYNFDYSDCQFVFFDQVLWESRKEPDYKWLDDKLSEENHYKHRFVVSHLPPRCDQMDEERSQRYNNIMNKHNITLSIHGHTHSYYQGNLMDDEMEYLVVDELFEGRFGIVHVSDTIEIEVVSF